MKMKRGNILQKQAVNILAALAAVCLFGCGSQSEKTNLQAGMELIEQYDFQGALECFDLARLNNEDLQLTSRGEGLAYMGLGEYEQAQDAFLASIQNAGNKLTALEYDTNYYLAAAYMKQGKYTEAYDIYSAIIALKSKETDAYYLRACVLLQQGDYEAAVADFEKVFALEPDDLGLVTDAYVEMQAAGFGEEGKTFLLELMEEREKSLSDGDKGTIYYYLEDYQNARTYLDGYLNGSDAKRSLLLGQTYEKLGDMNYATVVYQTYLASNEPDAAIYNSLGMCYMAQEKYEEALEAFEAGLATDSGEYLQELKFNMIAAYEYSGEFTQARTLMEEYLQAYPDDDKAKREYEFLQTR